MMPHQKPLKAIFGDEDDIRILTSSASPSAQLGFGSNFYSNPPSSLSTLQQQRGMSTAAPNMSSFQRTTPTSLNQNFQSTLSGSLVSSVAATMQQQQQQASPNRNLLGNLARGFPNISTQQNHQLNQALNGLQKRNNPISSAILSSGANAATSVPQSLSNFGLGTTRTGHYFNLDGQPNLDMSEFPSLGNRGGGGSNPSANVRNYVGMVKTANMQDSTPEFQIESEDFPALPGSLNPPSSSNGNELGSKFQGIPGIQGLSGTYGQADVTSSFSSIHGSKLNGSHPTPGIRTSPDGTVSNIPAGMVMDQFGMVGLLMFIWAAEGDQNLVTLAPGIDLTTLGLNLNSPDNLYSNFQSPWADSPCRPQDIDFHVPSEYLTNVSIRDKLAPIKLNRYGEELLFHLFYMNGGDVLQLAAASELYSRDWRYHKDERVWITRAPGMEPSVQTTAYERGTYYFFDAHNWRKIAKEFHLEYDKLEDRPHLPKLEDRPHLPATHQNTGH